MSDVELRFTTREWNLVYRVALRVLRTPDQAEDAAQDAMLRAFRARDRYSGKAKPDSWLYRIAHNTALSHLRRPFARRYASDDVFRLIDETSLEDDTSSPESDAIFRQLADELGECMSGMRTEDRVAFTERFILGTSEKELGEILGVSTNAAKQRAFRARKRVRCLLLARGSEATINAIARASRHRDSNNNETTVADHSHGMRAAA